MTEMRKILVRETAPKTVIDRYYVHSVGHNMGTLGEFIAVRRKRYDMGYRYRGDDGDDKERKDRKKYGKCIICEHKFRDDEKLFIAFSVHKNSKNLGNLSACENCFNRFERGNLNDTPRS